MASEKKKSQRQGNPYRTVLIWTIVLAVLTAGCLIGSRYINVNRNQLLQAMQEEVSRKNNEAYQAYQIELAEFQAEHNQDGANDAWPVPAATGWDVVDLTSYPLEEESTASVSRQEALYTGMLLVNQWHPIPDDFREDQLVSVSQATGRTVSTSSSQVSMFPDAVAALKSCIQDAKVQRGLDYYVANEAYRSKESQQKLVDSNKTSIPAGCSDYNAGQSVQITLYHKGDNSINDYSSHIFSSEHGQWLLENAWKYGLVFRFPLMDYPTAGTADKSYKTGVNVHLQTFRYVGLGNAAAMETLGLCLEEYIEYLAAHPHIAVFENGNLRYEIVRQYVGESDTFTIAVTGKRSVKNRVVSLDNMGYAITVFSY